MSAEISFWKRVGNVFRANGRDAIYSGGNGNKPALCVEAVGPERGNGRDTDHGGSPASSLLPWVRRQRSLEQLREGYQRVLELMDAMCVHFERQDRRAEELTASIDRVGGTLEQLANAQRSQSERVVSIASRVDEAAKYSAGLSATLLEMPASLQAQAESVRAVARQMEAARDADAQVVSSLHQVGQAVDSLRDAGDVQVQTLQRLRDSGARQEESLQAFVRKQSHLLLITAIIVTVLGLGAVAALAVVARMIFNT